jgi:hypothetical protein
MQMTGFLPAGTRSWKIFNEIYVFIIHFFIEPDISFHCPSWAYTKYYFSPLQFLSNV